MPHSVYTYISVVVIVAALSHVNVH